MSSHRISAIGDLHLTSKNGEIKANVPVTFLHADDSFLADVKGLKGTLASGDLLKFDGTNVVAQASSAFAQASALSDYLTTANASSTYLTSATASSTYLAQANEFVQSVEAGVLSVSAGELSIDLSSYLQSANQYVKSVGSNLSVNGSGELTVDLSGLLVSGDLSGYLQAADLGAEITSLAVVDAAVMKVGAKREKGTTVAYTGSFAQALSIPMTNNKGYRVCIEAVYRKSDHSKFGSLKYEAIYKRIADECVLVAATDSWSVVGDCAGDELEVVDATGNASIRVKGSASGGVGSAGDVSVSAYWIEA